jgi:hypothetical protein
MHSSDWPIFMEKLCGRRKNDTLTIRLLQFLSAATRLFKKPRPDDPDASVVRRKYCWVSARTAKRGQVSNFAVFLRNSLPVPGLP